LNAQKVTRGEQNIPKLLQTQLAAVVNNGKYFAKIKPQFTHFPLFILIKIVFFSLAKHYKMLNSKIFGQIMWKTLTPGDNMSWGRKYHITVIIMKKKKEE
jgi:hypothetical protein